MIVSHVKRCISDQKNFHLVIYVVKKNILIKLKTDVNLATILVKLVLDHLKISVTHVANLGLSIHLQINAWNKTIT